MSSTPETVVRIPLRKLRPGPGNFRSGNPWPDPDQDMADSIRSVGVVEPILVIPGGGKDAPANVYFVVAGHRRVAGSILAEKVDIPAIVRAMDELGAVTQALIENIHREDLTPMEEARAYARLMELGGLTQKDLAAKVGRSQAHISKRLALLRLEPAAQAYLDSGRLHVEDALAMVGMDAAHVERALHDIEALQFRRQDEVGELIGKIGAPPPRKRHGEAEEEPGPAARKDTVWEVSERDLVVFRELARRRISQTAALQRLRRLAHARDAEWAPEDLELFVALALTDTKAPRRRSRRK